MNGVYDEGESFTDIDGDGVYDIGCPDQFEDGLGGCLGAPLVDYIEGDDPNGDNDHNNDSYTAAGADPGASVPCRLPVWSGFRLLTSGFRFPASVPVWSGPAFGFGLVWLPVWSGPVRLPASSPASGLVWSSPEP